MNPTLTDNFYSANIMFSTTNGDSRTKPVKFEYGIASYDDYSNEYEMATEAERNEQINSGFFNCLFSAAFAGVIKTTYHVAKTIFVGMPKALLKWNRDYIRLHAQYIARDFQEAAGYLVAGFHDTKKGFFLVQRSIIQKECYDYISANMHRAKPSGQDVNPRLLDPELDIDEILKTCTPKVESAEDEEFDDTNLSPELRAYRANLRKIDNAGLEELDAI